MSCNRNRESAVESYLKRIKLITQIGKIKTGVGNVTLNNASFTKFCREDRVFQRPPRWAWVPPQIGNLKHVSGSHGGMDPNTASTDGTNFKGGSGLRAQASGGLGEGLSEGHHSSGWVVLCVSFGWAFCLFLAVSVA